MSTSTNNLQVTQALTRKYLNPFLPDYLHSLLPSTTDKMTSSLSRLGLDVIMKSLEEVEKSNPLIAPPITVSSWYTKHYLEGLHPNIAVIRHPDHLPDGQTIESTISSAFKNLTPASLSKLPGDTLKAIYGVTEDSILYWAHHEKLCLIDGKIAFMGGLDMCFGRWDTNQHAIADAHPGDINATVFPGQDYNNARIMDFEDVSHWQNNKLDRIKDPRMGWSDISISVRGVILDDLQQHFSQRWNFIYNEKMASRNDPKYSTISYKSPLGGYSNVDESVAHGIKEHLEHKLHEVEGDLEGKIQHHLRRTKTDQDTEGAPLSAGITCQLVRSCCKWSHGVPLEVSIHQ
jgi:phospholipase D1/2